MYHEIKTERLLLRPLNLEDLTSVHEYASDESNTKYTLGLPNRNIGETQEYLVSVSEEWAKPIPCCYEFAILFHGTLVGAITVELDEKRETGHLGWILKREYQGIGLATEAALAVKSFALNELNLKRLIARCDYRNIASYHLMERIGLKLEDDTGTRVYRKRNETARELTYSFTVD